MNWTFSKTHNEFIILSANFIETLEIKISLHWYMTWHQFKSIQFLSMANDTHWQIPIWLISNQLYSRLYKCTSIVHVWKSSTITFFLVGGSDFNCLWLRSLTLTFDCLQNQLKKKKHNRIKIILLSNPKWLTIANQGGKKSQMIVVIVDLGNGTFYYGKTR